MALLEKQLLIGKSLLPGAGKGLFTKKAISIGTRIVEYKGKVTTWKEVDDDNGKNGYIYYINRNHVINARPLINNNKQSFLCELRTKKLPTLLSTNESS